MKPLIELKTNGLWTIPESNEHLWDLISDAGGAEATHGAMLMLNYIASQYQAGNIKPAEKSGA